MEICNTELHNDHSKQQSIMTIMQAIKRFLLTL